MALKTKLADEIIEFIQAKDPEATILDVLVAITMVLAHVAVRAGAPLSQVMTAIQKAYKQMQVINGVEEQ